MKNNIDEIVNNNSEDFCDDFSNHEDEEEDNLNLDNFTDDEIINKIKDKLTILAKNIIKKIIKDVFMMMNLLLKKKEKLILFQIKF